MEQYEQIESTTKFYFTTARYYNMDQRSDLWVNPLERYHFEGFQGHQKAKQLADDSNATLMQENKPYFVVRVVKTTNVERV